MAPARASAPGPGDVSAGGGRVVCYRQTSFSHSSVSGTPP